MDKTTELLKALADKLGTTVEYLWPIMVAHQRIDAIVIIVSSGLLAAALLVAWCCFLPTALKAYKQEYGDPMVFIPHVVLAITFFIVTAISLSGISDAMYPEAAAIKELLHG